MCRRDQEASPPHHRSRLANVLARQRSDEVAQLWTWGRHYAERRASWATSELRRLSQERHTVLSELGRESRDLASHDGQTVSAATARELRPRSTLRSLIPRPPALYGRAANDRLHYSGLGLGLVTVPEASEAVDVDADPAPEQSAEAGAFTHGNDGEVRSAAKAGKALHHGPGPIRQSCWCATQRWPWPRRNKSPPNGSASSTKRGKTVTGATKKWPTWNGNCGPAQDSGDSR